MSFVGYFLEIAGWKSALCNEPDSENLRVSPLLAQSLLDQPRACLSNGDKFENDEQRDAT